MIHVVCLTLRVAQLLPERRQRGGGGVPASFSGDIIHVIRLAVGIDELTPAFGKRVGRRWRRIHDRGGRWILRIILRMTCAACGVRQMPLSSACSSVDVVGLARWILEGLPAWG